MGWGVPEARRQHYNSPMNSDLSGTRTTRTTTRPRMPFLGRTPAGCRGPTNIQPATCKKSFLWTQHHFVQEEMEAVQLSPGHKNYCADLAIKAKVQFSPQMLMMVTRQNMIITSFFPLRCATMRAGPLVSNATTSAMRWSTAWGNETIVCKSIRVVLKLLYLITLIKGWLYTENERVWTWEEIEAEVMIFLRISNFLVIAKAFFNLR